MTQYLLPKLTPEVIELSQKICEESSERVCPTCSSEQGIKNGSVHNGKKPKYQCKSCGRQFVINPTNSPVSEEIKQLIDRLLLERISLRGIARVTQVSWSWLQDYVNQKLARTPRQFKISGKTLGELVIECDVTCGHLLSARTIRFTSGLQLIVIREKLWGAILETELENQPISSGLLYQRFTSNLTSAYTDFWQAYKTVIPPKRHRVVGKQSGLTNHIERLNNTLRQRISRLVRQSLSFSKKLNNHIGAIWYFIHGYNAELEKI